MSVERNQFGPGNAGQRAFEAILQGMTCGAKINGKYCGKQASITVDYDVLGNHELVPACNEAHARLIQMEIETILASQNRSTVPGRNGFGRG